MNLENSYTPAYTDLIEMLRYNAEITPDTTVFTYLIDGEDEEEPLTFKELDEQVRLIASRLQKTPGSGGRVLLLYPPGLDYIRGLFACFYAGSVAVPTYPPDISRLERTMPRFLSIVRDAQPAIALTTSPILMMAQSLLRNYEELDGIEWIATDDVIKQDSADLLDWRKPELGEDSLAFLQYTSGSTAEPRGVMLSHGNLLHNLDAICCAFEIQSGDRAVFWLPFYHDMGLIGGILAPVYCGAGCLLLSPLDFLQRPLRWLNAISRSKATISGGPNFAYDLAVRKVTPEQKKELDLSSWKIAFNGAEPVRADTLARFAETFRDCGFERDAFYPAYGLAEATVFVTGGERSEYPLVKAFDQENLKIGRVVPHKGEPDSGGISQDINYQKLVSAGTPRRDIQVHIVDPETAEILGNPTDANTHVGEIWVGGRSVAGGYWNRDRESDRVFYAKLREYPGQRFMRTGDLGFKYRGELFIAGRLKDLIILDGFNHYPQDIELTVERSHPALRPGCSAAFSIDVRDREQLVVVAEVAKPKYFAELENEGKVQLTYEMITRAIVNAVSQQHDLRVHDVVLLKPGSVPKTSSGKIQRHACKAGYLDNSLDRWLGTVD